MKLARPLQNVIDAFQRLPGIGPKSAQRLGFYLLHVPQEELNVFADALVKLKSSTVECSICFNVAESDPCPVCSDNGRNKDTVCVVEESIDILALEASGKFNGRYHVLHGRIDPLNNIRPEDLRIEQLSKRLQNGTPIEEVILALNPDMEGEATCMYLHKKIKAVNPELKITRLAHGLPTGASIEYADALTLSRAIDGRREY